MQTYKVTVDKDKTIRWFNDKGELHRLDGRLDGPAVEYADGSKEWYVDGKLHRLDGPAIEYTDGHKAWYVNGEDMTEKEFNEYIKPKPSCEGKVVEVDGAKYKLVKA
jgi:hypothetical protein